jgi:hypothetical protein
MFKEGQTIIFRSYKIHDRWYDGVITSMVIKGRERQYKIKTNLKGIHSEVIRFEMDIKIRK